MGSGLLVFFASITAGCAAMNPPDGGPLALRISVEQSETGDIIFDVFARDTIFLFYSFWRPGRISNLTVKDANGNTMWAIGRSGDAPPISQIKYSVLPQGFSQIAPRGAAPPRLESDTEYEVQVRSGVICGTTKFLHE